LKIENGKVYARGYDIEVINEVIDVEKPRDTETNTSSVSLEVGSLFRVNNVTSTPQLRKEVTLYAGLGQSGPTQEDGSGDYGVGTARVYSFNLTDSPYTNSSTSWDLRLYDIQTYTILEINSDYTLSSGDYIRGKYSGARGFVVADSSDNRFRLRQTSGTFIAGEPLIQNGIDISKTIVHTWVYGIQDIKSIKQVNATQGFSNGGSDFIADFILGKEILQGGIAQVNISAADAGISTVTSGGRPFSGIKKDDIIRYQRSGITTETFSLVVDVDDALTSFTITGISTVYNVFDGGLSANEFTTPISIAKPDVRGSGVLYIPLFDENISEVDFLNSKLRVVGQIQSSDTVDPNDNYIEFDTGDFSGANSDLNLNPSNSSFVGFDQENYALFYSDGTVAPLSDDAF